MTNKSSNMNEDMSQMPLSQLPLAMAYVPMQVFEYLYTPEVGFSRGTIFQKLDLPFLGAEGVYHG